MSTRNKRRRTAREETPADAEVAQQSPSKKPAAPPPSAPVDPAEERRAQRLMSVVGFAMTGLLMGLLAGANQAVAVPEAGSALAQAARIGSAVAVHTADWVRGGAFGTLGLVLGAGFGFSLFLSPSLMFLSWLGGAVGLAAGMATGFTLVGAAGWVAGMLAVLLRAGRERLNDL